jgi:Zn-dependent M16 (insulinase) family peptidase
MGLGSQLIARFEKELAAGPYLERLIEKWLLGNPHRVTVIMTSGARGADQVCSDGV